MGLDKKYAEALQLRSFGYGLYHPEYDNVIAPGSCGYFDNDGLWQPIVNIPKIDAKNDLGLSRMKEKYLRVADPIRRKWGPQCSRTVKGEMVAINLVTSIPTSVPVTLGAGCKFTSESEVGAVLLAKPDVVLKRYYYTHPFKAWESKNAHKIIERYPDVVECGMWIVTGTWATSKCSLTAWESKKDSATIGLEGKVQSVADITLEHGWYTGQASSGWQEMNSQDGFDVVVFIHGIRFEYSWLRSLFFMNPMPPVEGCFKGKPAVQSGRTTGQTNTPDRRAQVDPLNEVDQGEETEEIDSDEPETEERIITHTGSPGLYSVSCQEW